MPIQVLESKTVGTVAYTKLQGGPFQRVLVITDINLQVAVRQDVDGDANKLLLEAKNAKDGQEKSLTPQANEVSNNVRIVAKDGYPFRRIVVTVASGHNVTIEPVEGDLDKVLITATGA